MYFLTDNRNKDDWKIEIKKYSRNGYSVWWLTEWGNVGEKRVNSSCIKFSLGVVR